MKTNLTLVLFLAMLLCVSCGSNESKPAKASLVVPVPPAMMTDPVERADFLAAHYWDNYDFADTVLVHNADVAEQGVSNYIDILRMATPTKAAAGIKSMLGKAVAGDSVVFSVFCDLYEKYLYDPNSPLRNETLYIPVLEFIVASPAVDELMKIAPRARLALALKNRPSDKAIDFAFETDKGGRSSLYAVDAPYTVIFFNNPDCHDCARVKQYMIDSPVFKELQKDKTLKVAAIYADDDLAVWRKGVYPREWINGHNGDIHPNQTYDLRASPTMYLLDRDKRVILKDAPVEQIEGYLFNTTQNKQN